MAFLIQYLLHRSISYSCSHSILNSHLGGCCCGSYVVAFYYVLALVCVALFGNLRGWLRVLLETLDISTIATTCACFGSGLHVRAPGEFYFNTMSWVISARVRVWKLVLLITIGIMWSCTLLLLCVMRAYFRGSYMVCMLFMVSSMLLLSVSTYML